MITPNTTPSIENEDYLPARMLNEFAYCPRLFYLEHVDGLFAHNADTIEGAARHTRVDEKTTSLPASKRKRAPKDDEIEDLEKEEREVIHARSVTLSSERHGILAKLDLVETDGLNATPVDYKRGSPKKLDDGTLGAWDPERIQICVQALVLRENGFACDEGVLFFWETRQRVRIAIDDELIQLTLSAIAGARELQSSDVAPPPLVDSPKCPRCSLVGICLPDETSYCRHSPSGDARQQPLLFDIGPTRMQSVSAEPPSVAIRVRQMVTARDDRKPLYLNTQGFSLGKSGDVLQAKDKGKLVQEFRMNDVSQVNIMGNVQVTTQAIQSLLQAEIPLVYFSYGGWFHGMTQGVGLKNILSLGYSLLAKDLTITCAGVGLDPYLGFYHQP